MRNMLLILQREYVERVRTKSFVVFTVLVPVLMAAMIVVPILMVTRSAVGSRRLVVVTSDAALGESIRQQLVAIRNPVAEADAQANKNAPPVYTVTVDTRLTEDERTALRRQVIDNELDGFLWIGEQALNPSKPTSDFHPSEPKSGSPGTPGLLAVPPHQVEYVSRQFSNLGEYRPLELAVQTAVLRQNLAAQGFKEQQVAELLRPVSVKVVRIANGKEGAGSDMALFTGIYVMVMIIYMSVLLYCIAVMRSVIEEKSSRIMEVMLASATPQQLLAGKILGVGAAGLTQIAIWVLAAAGLSLFALASGGALPVHLPLSTAISFAGFFLLGYLLYSALYAAVGAMVNREQEAQQVQFLVMMPLIACVVLLQAVIQDPGSRLSFWASMIPFCSPLLMFARTVIATPPVWQILLSLFLLLITIYGVLVVSARIYRVGILMYGKRPTLPELVKWIKYA